MLEKCSHRQKGHCDLDPFGNTHNSSNCEMFPVNLSPMNNLKVTQGHFKYSIVDIKVSI